MLNNEYIQAYTEISCLLNYMPKEYIDKLPNKLIDFIHKQSNEIYNIAIDVNKSLAEQNFSKRTKDFIAVLKYNYWSTYEEKAELRKLFNENEQKYQKILLEKYNTDNLFKKKNVLIEEIKENTECKGIIKYKKENLLKKILNVY